MNKSQYVDLKSTIRICVWLSCERSGGAISFQLLRRFYWLALRTCELHRALSEAAAGSAL